jgi:hypothetical protein
MADTTVLQAPGPLSGTKRPRRIGGPDFRWGAGAGRAQGPIRIIVDLQDQAVLNLTYVAGFESAGDIRGIVVPGC